jgi:hypothetical protein
MLEVIGEWWNYKAEMDIFQKLSSLDFLWIHLTKGKFCRLLFWPLLLDQELLQPVLMHLWQHCLRITGRCMFILEYFEGLQGVCIHVISWDFVNLIHRG